MLVEYLFVFFCRVSLSHECLKMVQLHELGSKWETNYLRYICVIAVFLKFPSTIKGSRKGSRVNHTMHFRRSVAYSRTKL